MDLEDKINIKNTIQDTQLLIRNNMDNHKKTSKQLHSQIKKDQKTKALFTDKIAKLTIEKEQLEMKQQSKNENEHIDPPNIKNLKDQIIREIEEKKEYDQKILEIKDDFLTIKNEMGGLNATQQVQVRFEKHIRILENRLDKANQKFNDSIEYDKKLRAEIDKLRKERFFFENIYKRLEKELEKIRKDISKNLEDAYDNFEQRDMNQESFENITAEMLKLEAEYTNILSRIANDLDLRNSRKKSLERKDVKPIKMDNADNLKNYSKKIKSEQYEQQQENLNEKYDNMKYKFEKLLEFTEQENVGDFCEKFKKNASKNFELFVAISMMSSEAKKLESEIKEIDEEMNILKKNKNSQQGLERQSLVSDYKTKMQKLIQKQSKCENETLKFNEEFTQVKNHIKSLFNILECDVGLTEEERIMLSQDPNDNNILEILAKIEQRLKLNQKVFEYEKSQNDEDVERFPLKNEKGKLNPKTVNDNMKSAFSSMDISKIKSMEKIKTDHKADDFKFDNLKVYSEKVADEIMDTVLKANQNDKKQPNKQGKKTKK